MSPIDPRILRRLIYQPNGCLTWGGALDRGYGKGNYDDRTIRIHRYVYTQVHGPVANDLDLDHLCRNRACANPHHLEPVTRRENLRRGAGTGGALWRAA